MSVHPADDFASVHFMKSHERSGNGISFIWPAIQAPLVDVSAGNGGKPLGALSSLQYWFILAGEPTQIQFGNSGHRGYCWSDGRERKCRRRASAGVAGARKHPNSLPPSQHLHDTLKVV